MKKILVTALALGSVCSVGPVFAASNEDVLARLAALEKENAAIRQENAALRENKKLRHENASLKSSSAPAQAVAASGAKRSDPFAAYVADLPMAYKAPAAYEPGRFRIWGEGGAMWTGGDTVQAAYAPGSAVGAFVGLPGSNVAGVFDLKPKLGWQAAAGFDYRFAGSPWHASGQFRYGESGKASGAASSASFLDLSAIVAPGATASSSDNTGVSYGETHWIADLAVGKDILGNGPETMQLKGGLRVTEFVGRTDLSQNSLAVLNFGAPLAIPGGGAVTSISQDSTNTTRVRNSFLGAGPLVGIDGSIPLASGWAFDYSGNAAVLFGTQKTATSSVTNVLVTPTILAAFGGTASSSTVTTVERFATVLSADMQVGVSYWLTQNVKLGVSYRFDAMMNVQNQSSTGVTNQTPDRYTHGPLVRVSATF